MEESPIKLLPIVTDHSGPFSLKTMLDTNHLPAHYKKITRYISLRYHHKFVFTPTKKKPVGYSFRAINETSKPVWEYSIVIINLPLGVLITDWKSASYIDYKKKLEQVKSFSLKMGSFREAFALDIEPRSVSVCHRPNCARAPLPTNCSK